MIVRAIDATNDWTFGKGIEDYKSNVDAVAQNIKTRLQSFLGDCFFASNVGIDWFNLIGGKNQITLQLAIAGTIMNTDFVTQLTQLSISLTNRAFSVSFSCITNFGVVQNQTVIVSPPNYLLTQSGDILETESGQPIII